MTVTVTPDWGQTLLGSDTSDAFGVRRLWCQTPSDSHTGLPLALRKCLVRRMTVTVTPDWGQTLLGSDAFGVRHLWCQTLVKCGDEKALNMVNGAHGNPNCGRPRVESHRLD